MSSSGFTPTTKTMSATYRSKPFGRLQGRYHDLICAHWLKRNKQWLNLLVRRISDFGFETITSQASAFIQNINIALNAIPHNKRKGVAMM